MSKVKELSKEQSTINDWVRIFPDFLEQYPQYRNNQMRHLLLNREINGFDEHVRKIGRALYLNVKTFPSWIESQSER